MSTIDRVREEARKSPDELAREIEDARARVGETLDELQERLRPRQLIGEAAASVRMRSGRVARNLRSAALQKPLWVIGAGVGLALLATWRARHSSRRDLWY
jgi:hypothetical protein